MTVGVALLIIVCAACVAAVVWLLLTAPRERWTDDDRSVRRQRHP